MSGENKFLIGIGIGTLVIIVAGVLFFSKKQAPASTTLSASDKSQLTENAKHTKGDINAPVTIVEFGDIQCPACKAAQPIVHQMLEKYSQNTYFVFRHYPLSVHKNSEVAAKAAEAAGAQGKFFEMVDYMFTNQSEWSEVANPRELFGKYAEQFGLNPDQFKQDMDKDWENIMSDFALGNKVAVESTPTFFINGEKYSGALQPEQFQQIIEDIINSPK
jgi:protein-disulfide isomerase